MKEPTILILLAAYNGAAYLRPMVDSLLAQEGPSVQIILSDDGSSDETPDILAQYAAGYPETVIHYRSGQRFGCAQKHFAHLLERFRDADYVMFCDQDDIWHKDKVRKTLALMLETERPGVPTLVHTDLRVVDREGKELSPSFCLQSDLDGDRMALNHLLVQNVVTGCTVMINRPLAELACRCRLLDADMVMHDWWLALLAAACGNTAFLKEATIDYRQHGNNSVGAKNVRSPAYLLHRLRSQKMRGAMKAAAQQAESFLLCYGDALSEEQNRLLAAFAATKDAGILRRDRIYLQYGLLKKGLVRRTAQLLGL